MQKFAITYPGPQTDSGWIASFLWSTEEGYLPVLRLYEEQVYRLKLLIYYSCAL